MKGYLMTSATERDARTGVPDGGSGPLPARPPRRGVGRHVVGGFFLVMGGVHLGLVAADPQIYDGFADNGLFAFVRSGWQEIVMVEPAVYGLLLMAGEVLLGAALLIGGRAATLGWIGVITFHFLLLLFGWGV